MAKITQREYVLVEGQLPNYNFNLGQRAYASSPRRKLLVGFQSVRGSFETNARKLRSRLSSSANWKKMIPSRELVYAAILYKEINVGNVHQGPEKLVARPCNRPEADQRRSTC